MINVLLFYKEKLKSTTYLPFIGEA